MGGVLREHDASPRAEPPSPASAVLRAVGTLSRFNGGATYHETTSFTYLLVRAGLVPDYWRDWRPLPTGCVESPTLLTLIGRLRRKGLLSTRWRNRVGVDEEVFYTETRHLYLVDPEWIRDPCGSAHRFFHRGHPGSSDPGQGPTIGPFPGRAGYA